MRLLFLCVFSHRGRLYFYDLFSHICEEYIRYFEATGTLTEASSGGSTGPMHMQMQTFLSCCIRRWSFTYCFWPLRLKVACISLVVVGANKRVVLECVQELNRMVLLFTKLGYLYVQPQGP
jgi:hypothetical protein